MIRSYKVRTIATFELLTTVKRTGYLVTTFGMPLFIAGYAAIVAVPAYYAEKRARVQTVIGVVDAAGVMHLQRDTPAPESATAPEELPQNLTAPAQSRAKARELDRPNLL